MACKSKSVVRSHTKVGDHPVIKSYHRKAKKSKTRTHKIGRKRA
jgi:hypothetical protein